MSFDRRSRVSFERTGVDQSLARQMSVLFLGRTAAFAVVFAVPLVLARVFPPEGFGLYKQLFLIHATLTSVLAFGLSASLFYFVPRRAEQAAAYIAQTLLTLAGLGLAGGVLLAAGKAQVAQAMNNPALEPYLPYVAVLTVLSVTTSLLESVMVILKQVRWAAATGVASELLRAVLLGGAALATRSMLALVIAATVWGACRLAALLVYLRRIGVSGLPRPDRCRFMEQVRYTAPFGLAVLVKTLTEGLHQFVVSALYTPALFAVYSVGYLQIPVVAIACESVSDVTLLRVTELRNQGLLAEAAHLVGSGAVKLCLFLLPLWGWLTVSARDLLVVLFTEQYEAATALFRVFLVMIPLTALGLDYVPRAFADTGFILRVNVLRLALSGLLLAALVPPLGPGGAALATVLAMAAAKGVVLRRAGVLLGVGLRGVLPWRRLVRIGAVAWTAGLAAWPLHASGAFGPGARVLLSCGLFGLCYGALAWTTGVVSPDLKRRLAERAGAWLGPAVPGLRS